MTKGTMASYFVIRKYGYEYFLTQVDRRLSGIPDPNFMGMLGWALHHCHRIGEHDPIFRAKTKRKSNEL